MCYLFIANSISVCFGSTTISFNNYNTSLWSSNLPSIWYPLDTLPSNVIGLFEGVCKFEPDFGVYEYAVYTFEDGSQDWKAWNSQTPKVSKDEVFCGYQSLYVSNIEQKSNFHSIELLSCI